jgi:hypothetical protein
MRAGVLGRLVRRAWSPLVGLLVILGRLVRLRKSTRAVEELLPAKERVWPRTRLRSGGALAGASDEY